MFTAGKERTVKGTADLSDPDVKDLLDKLNLGITEDGSQVIISDLSVSYDFHLKARNTYTSIDYHVILDGALTNYVITRDSQRALIDLGWRGISTDSDIVINGNPINIPLNLIKSEEPNVYAILAGTDAQDVLNLPLINADFILKQPITNWHFLFDPTGINVDAGTFGLNEEISGFVVSRWTMGESGIREGRQVDTTIKAEIASDQNYIVRSVQSADQANLSVIGFGALDKLDGVEIAGVTPTPPEGYATTSTGGFPIMIVYGMAGIAAIAGIGFFIFSNRSLKREAQGQQGIDPNRLQGYETSSSSGGYKTNRGEAQLKDDTSYKQTRNVYEETTQQSPPASAPQEAACGCAASAEMGSECDCVMQNACICDVTCQCGSNVCKDLVRSMS